MDNEVYSFEVAIGFAVTASNKHDAMQAALAVEQSLNDSSIQASYGGNATVIRSKAPTMRRFLKTKRKMPNQPVQRSRTDEIVRRQAKLDVLTFKWGVVLSKNGKIFGYSITAPTKEQAIERARIKCYHETSHLGTSLQSVKQEDA